MQSARRMRRLVIVCLGLCGCAAPASPEGPVARSLTSAAASANVPRDLVVAIAVEEGGVFLRATRLPDPADHVPVAGALELRHGAFDSLARGAALVGADELALRSATDLGTRAGALVLAELGRRTNVSFSLDSWRPAVAILSGLSDAPSRARYVEDVFQR